MNTLTHALQYPIKRGETTVDTLTVTKPLVGQLKGLKITDIVQMDTVACEKLLPRITELTPTEVLSLDPYDFTMLMEKVVGFFVLADPQMT